MSKREKLLQRLRQNPKNVSFQTLRSLIESYGFELKRTKGSHHSFVAEIKGQKILLVVPYRKPLKPIYVKQALELIEQIEAEIVTDEVNENDE